MNHPKLLAVVIASIWIFAPVNLANAKGHKGKSHHSQKVKQNKKHNKDGKHQRGGQGRRGDDYRNHRGGDHQARQQRRRHDREYGRHYEKYHSGDNVDGDNTDLTDRQIRRREKMAEKDGRWHDKHDRKYHSDQNYRDRYRDAREHHRQMHGDEDYAAGDGAEQADDGHEHADRSYRADYRRRNGDRWQLYRERRAQWRQQWQERRQMHDGHQHGQSGGDLADEQPTPTADSTLAGS